MKTINAIILATALLFSAAVSAQTVFTARSYDMKVSGTSNMHDWDMKATNANINAQFVLKTGQISDITGLDFSMPVKGLKSTSDLMDSRTYSTLKAEKHQKIFFKLSAAEVTQQPNKQYLIKATGMLTIAGVAKEVVLTANGVMSNDKLIVVNGTKKIKMSEWGIKPPSFMFGAMQVGNEVTINFNLKFNG